MAVTRDKDGKSGVLSMGMNVLGYDTTSAWTTTTTTAGGGVVECIDLTVAPARGFAGNDVSSTRPSGLQASSWDTRAKVHCWEFLGRCDPAVGPPSPASAVATAVAGATQGKDEEETSTVKHASRELFPNHSDVGQVYVGRLCLREQGIRVS